jgi:hypothetical protein
VAACLLGDRSDRHAKLAVGGLAQRAGVLALHPHRVVAVLGEAGVVHRPRGRLERADEPLGQAAADRPPVPRADGDEVVQRLVVHLAQPLGHRLNRLAAPVQHQPTQVAHAASALILPPQRLEDVVREGFQASADSGQPAWCGARHRLLSTSFEGTDSLTRQPSQANLTGSY